MNQWKILWLVAGILLRFSITTQELLVSWLSTRIEIATPANGMLPIREGLALLNMGISPYSGSSCHAPPLVMALWAAQADHSMVVYMIPQIIADALTSMMLQEIASKTLIASGT